MRIILSFLLSFLILGFSFPAFAGQCTSSVDCGPLEDCISYQCQAVTRPQTGRCNSDFDCSSGRKCVNGRCVRHALDDLQLELGEEDATQN
jgi:hypothetical protein